MRVSTVRVTEFTRRRCEGAARGVFALCLPLLVAGCAPSFDTVVADQSAPAIKSEVFVADDGVQLPIRTWTAGPHPKAILVAVHGFNDYSYFIDEAAAYFSKAGIYTLAYDQRGFGATAQRGFWQGAAPMAADLRSFLRRVRRDYPTTPLIVLGESMGAAVLAKALVEEERTLADRVILSAPAVWSRDTMPWYQRAGLWVTVRLFPGMKLSGKGVRIIPSDNLEMRRGLSRDPLVIKETRVDALFGVTDLMDEAIITVPRVKNRTLLLYGAQDEVIPKAPMGHLLEKGFSGGSENFRFVYYAAGYHMLLRDLQRKVVWDDIVSWVLNPDAVMPSGHELSASAMLAKIQAADR